MWGFGDGRAGPSLIAGGCTRGLRRKSTRHTLSLQQGAKNGEFQRAFLSRKRLGRLNRGQPPDRRTIAENDDLPRAFSDLVAPAANFGHEPVHPGEAFNVAGLAPDYAALLDSFAGEQIGQPDVRG